MKRAIQNIVLLVLFVFYSCNEKKAYYILQFSDASLELNNGILFYHENPFNGVLYRAYDSHNKRFEIEYLEGKKHGYEKQWFENGQLAQERFYTHGSKSGIHKGYWEHGNLKFVYHFNEQGNYDGSVKEWYQTGVLLRDFNYKLGKEAGRQQMWLPNGNIRANYEVIHGERFGLIGLKKCYQVTSGSDEIQ